MPKSSNDPELVELLKRLGMPEHCRRFQLTVELGDVVRAEAEYMPDPKTGEFVRQRYILVSDGEPESLNGGDVTAIGDSFRAG